MELQKYLYDVIAAIFLVITVQALVFKRDRNEKYAFWPLLIPPLTIMYLLMAPLFGTQQTPHLSPFEQQVLGYQVAALAMVFVSRMESQAGQVGFWLAAFLNFGTGALLVYFARFWTM